MSQHKQMVPPRAEGRQKVQILLPVDTWRKAKAAAAMRGIDAQDIVREALQAYLEGRLEPELRTA